MEKKKTSKKESSRIIDFRSVSVVTGVDKDPVIIDISKKIGNIIYSETGDISMLDLAKDIYYNGQVSCTEEQIACICNIVKGCGIKAIIQIGLLKLLA